MSPDKTGCPLGGMLEQHSSKDGGGLGAEGWPLSFRGGAASGVQLSGVRGLPEKREKII